MTSAANILVGYHPGSGSSGGFVAGVSASGQTPLGNSSCDVVPGGSCAINFPSFGILAAQAGWETSNGGARILAGPALAFSRGTGVFAGQVRVDLAKRLSYNFSLLASGRVAYVPDFQGNAFSLGAIGVGFRVR